MAKINTMQKGKGEFHDDICTLVDYKKKLNDFYREKYGGLDITDIMEGEMAGAENRLFKQSYSAFIIDTNERSYDCNNHKGSEKVHS